MLANLASFIWFTTQRLVSPNSVYQPPLFELATNSFCWVSWLVIWSCLSLELDLWLNSTSFLFLLSTLAWKPSSVPFTPTPFCCTCCVRITAPQVAFLPTKSYVFSSESTASFILYYPACRIKAFVLEISLARFGCPMKTSVPCVYSCWTDSSNS